MAPVGVGLRGVDVDDAVVRLAVLGELVPPEGEAPAPITELWAIDLELRGHLLTEVVVTREADLVFRLTVDRPATCIELHPFIGSGWRQWRDLVRVGIVSPLAAEQLEGAADDRIGGSSAANPELHRFELIFAQRLRVDRHRLAERAELGVVRCCIELEVQEAAALIAGVYAL